MHDSKNAAISEEIPKSTPKCSQIWIFRGSFSIFLFKGRKSPPQVFSSIIFFLEEFMYFSVRIRGTQNINYIYVRVYMCVYIYIYIYMQGWDQSEAKNPENHLGSGACPSGVPGQRPW